MRIKRDNIFSPYAKATEAVVEAGTWTTSSHVTLGEIWPAWDCSTFIEVSRSIAIDVAALWTECLLNEKDGIRLAPAWHCKQTSLRGCGKPIDFGLQSEKKTVQVDLKIDGNLLAGNVLLKTQLILSATQRATRNPLAAKFSGSVLWEDSQVIQLDMKTRFPIDIVDFSSNESGLPGDGGWYISWISEALDQSIYSGMRLYINSSHPKIIKAVQARPSGNDFEDMAILSFLYFDIGRTLITGALKNDEFVNGREEYGGETIGCAIQRLISSTLKRDARQLREMMIERPDEFNCFLQDRLKLFHRDNE